MNLFNFAIILHPSMRSLAYLNIFAKNKILPKEVIVMGDWPFVTKHIFNEADKYDYADKYFPLNYDLERLKDHSEVNYCSVKNTNINDIELRNIIQNSKCKNFIFTGGGILRKDILSLNKNFIHVHPGNIENYRGSTCFYYSYLNNHNISCTTFIMKEKLDRGDILNISDIEQNILINNDQKYFIDYIYDPYIRSLALEKALPLFVNNKKLEFIKTDNFNGIDHHVAHPIIRNLFVKKINNAYQENNKKGVYLSNG